MQTKTLNRISGYRLFALQTTRCLAVSAILLFACHGFGQGLRTRPEWPFDRSAAATDGGSISRWTLVVSSGKDGIRTAVRLGASFVEQRNAAATVYLIDFGPNPPTFEALRQRARLVPGIISLEPLSSLSAAPLSVPTDPLLSQQWLLKNNAVANADIDMAPVWSMTTGNPPVPIDGRGVTIGIVDSGFDYTHQDLSANFSLAYSYDAFGKRIAPPGAGVAHCIKEADLKFCHGTVVAGVAAENENEIGGVGVAPSATLADQRLTYNNQLVNDMLISETEAFEADPISIKNNSWGFCGSKLGLGHYSSTPYNLANFVCAKPLTTHLLPVRFGSMTLGTLFDITNTSGSYQGRGGLGEILTWAGGNEGSSADRAHERSNPNDPGYLYVGGWNGYTERCNRYAIVVSAINSAGTIADYSAPGPCNMVAAPGGDRSNQTSLGIVSTDLANTGSGFNPAPANAGGAYTLPNNTKTVPSVVGTSFAAPAVAGIASLMLQVKPTLEYRDVMHILVNTARKIDPNNPSWFQNAGSHWVSRDYGFGLVDAAAAVAQAATWTNVGVIDSEIPTQKCYNIAMTHSVNGTTESITLAKHIKIEHIEVLVGVTHPQPGNLQVKVKSPSGTTTVLGPPQQQRLESNLFYLFTTTHFWDEQAPGLWQVTVTDVPGGPTGTFNCVSVNSYGADY